MAMTVMPNSPSGRAARIPSSRCSRSLRAWKSARKRSCSWKLDSKSAKPSVVSLIPRTLPHTTLTCTPRPALRTRTRRPLLPPTRTSQAIRTNPLRRPHRRHAPHRAPQSPPRPTIAQRRRRRRAQPARRPLPRKILHGPRHRLRVSRPPSRQAQP